MAERGGSVAVVRCPRCGATTRARIRAGVVRGVELAHEDGCTWLRANERGVPVAPVQVEVVEKKRS
jgi:uncharacterized C2H2 Zn-finger protein